MKKDVIVGVPRAIDKALLMRAVEALREQAHMLAGQSQAPHLFRAEETQAWADAEVLEAAVKQGLLP